MNHKNQIPTIFNNVIGPITAGPSTSNTCGPCRIAYLCSKLVNGKLKKATVVFPSESAFVSSYIGMRSDYGFANGFLGKLPDTPDFLQAFDLLAEQGIALEFVISEDFKSEEPLTSLQRLTAEDGETIEVVALSKGGGTIELCEIDGFPVSINGDRHEVLVFTETDDSRTLDGIAEQARQLDQNLYGSDISDHGKSGLIVLHSDVVISEKTLLGIQEIDGVSSVKALPAVFPVIVRSDYTLPFKNADQLKSFCNQHGKQVWEAAVEYEMAVSGWTANEVMNYAYKVLETARQSVKMGLSNKVAFDGILPLTAKKMSDYFKSGKTIPAGILNRASAYSTAIMEYSNSSGVVVCMPTAGAAGVVSGVLVAAAEELGLGDEAIVKAYLTGGAIGIAISEDNYFCGAIYGCQAEVGCASCMAAAALAYLLNASVDQILDSASMALQNMLGLICDPVCGLVQVPCFSRDLSGIANSVVSANAVIAGFDPCIPLDQVFEVMKDVGNKLPAELRGQGGGLCKCQKAVELEGAINADK